MHPSKLALLALAATSLSAQQVATMRASIRGGGDPNGGKCTIEVNIDDAAEVEISGDQGRIRTLAGQPSEWRRFECSSVMPGRPADFRFQGIDGRGRVQLVRDPRENRGVAVVRIEDPKGGREGYTFDLIWQGGDRRDFGRSDRAPVTLTCASDDMRRHYCDADTRDGVRLVRQRSQAQCRQGESWGYDRRGIWVDRGCRADFEVGR
jgi:hypothetical protein